MELAADLPRREADQQQHLGNVDALPDLTSQLGPRFAVGGILRCSRIRHRQYADALLDVFLQNALALQGKDPSSVIEVTAFEIGQNNFERCHLLVHAHRTNSDLHLEIDH